MKLPSSTHARVLIDGLLVIAFAASIGTAIAGIYQHLGGPHPLIVTVALEAPAAYLLAAMLWNLGRHGIDHFVPRQEENPLWPPR